MTHARHAMSCREMAEHLSDYIDRVLREDLRVLIDAHRGDCPVTLELVRPGSYAVAVAPSAAYRVRPDPDLKQEVEALLGPGALQLARTNGVRANTSLTANGEGSH